MVRTMDSVCGECGFKARSAGGLRKHEAAKHPPKIEGHILEETDRSLAAADHLTDADAGAVAVLRELAKTIDGFPERDPSAPLDNVTVPTYLKYAAELGLTPLARLKMAPKEQRSGSKLAELRALRSTG